MLNYIITNWMDVLGTTLGLLYIYLELKENAWMWVVGSVMPVIYFFVLWDKGVYGDCATEVYAFLAGLYGLYVWLRGSRSPGDKLPITRTPLRMRRVLVGVTLVLWGVLAFILKHTDSTVAYIDALSTAFYLVALWMLARKYLEQWLMWLVCDALSTGLYIYKGIYGRALLYGLYTLLAIYGYQQWKKRVSS
ncbi:MAG: nicotinamide riboside transporter PnuC [Bacteroidaceae bacterium]|nr:nicotinamide riboside transporter PnuC [Bacteroidaceae bacterium]